LKLSEPEAIGRQRSRRILSHQIERIVAKDMPVARLVALPRQHRIARHAERPAPEILIGQLGELLPKHHRHLLHHIVRILPARDKRAHEPPDRSVICREKPEKSVMGRLVVPRSSAAILHREPSLAAEGTKYF